VGIGRAGIVTTNGLSRLTDQIMAVDRMLGLHKSYSLMPLRCFHVNKAVIDVSLR